MIVTGIIIIIILLSCAFIIIMGILLGFTANLCNIPVAGI